MFTIITYISSSQCIAGPILPDWSADIKFLSCFRKEGLRLLLVDITTTQNFLHKSTSENPFMAHDGLEWISIKMLELRNIFKSNSRLHWEVTRWVHSISRSLCRFWNVDPLWRYSDCILMQCNVIPSTQWMPTRNSRTTWSWLLSRMYFNFASPLPSFTNRPAQYSICYASIIFIPERHWSQIREVSRKWIIQH